MKKFKSSHLFFKDSTLYFDETNLPVFLLDKEYKWWYDRYVLKLKIGESIKSDFQKIERIE